MPNRLALLVALAFAHVLVAQAKGPKKSDDPPAGYKKDNLRGFTLYFSDEVLKKDKDSKLKRKPLEALERELIIVESVVPADKVRRLKTVPIWVEWDERIAMSNGRRGRAVAVFYGGHQSDLLGGDASPLKANAVTILSLRSLTDEHQPDSDSGRCVTLHELAHAFHHHVLGNENAQVLTAYRTALERKLYDAELYAATNNHEYFAEMTCAYLDRLDYFPRTRDELKKHDVKGYELMEKVWGKVIDKKEGVAAKGPKLPSPDGDGQYKLTVTAEKLRLGQAHFGELPPRSDWKGHPVFVLIFPGDYGKALALLPRANAWHAELKDFGLITVGAETEDLSADDLEKIVRQRGVTFPLVGGARVGGGDDYDLPHGVVYDCDGRCVFRGTPLDAEKYIRIAVGTSILTKMGVLQFGKAAQPVADLLLAGTPMAQVFAKLAEQQRVTAKDAGDELKELQTALTSGGKHVLDMAVDKAKADPIAAYFEVERLPAAYRGTPLEKAANDHLAKVRANPKVEWELKARAALEPIKKLDTQLAGKDRSFNPRSLYFKEDNAGLLQQFKEAVEKQRKTYPSTRAADDALKLAERWDVKVR